MKVSIITLHSSINYGSVLQTFATQRVFEKLGHQVEFVDYNRHNNTDEELVKKSLRGPKFRLASKMTLGLADRLLYKIAYMRLVERAVPMRKFLKEYVNFTPRAYSSNEELKKNTPIADVYVTGSDQVWNSIWNGGFEKPFFLDYAPEGKKRIAFSASIGRTELDEEEEADTVQALKKYYRISMREQSGVNLLKKYGIKSALVLDPTLMLNADEWRSIALKPKEPKKYLLVYQLNNNRKMFKYARQIAEKNGLEIIRISKNEKKSLRKHEHYVRCKDIRQLIGLFVCADCVLTDSFHATSFSLNLHKKFIVVLPERFNTRLVDITQLTGTSDRILTDFSDISLCKKDIDWNKVDNILEEKRAATNAFLQEALS